IPFILVTFGLFLFVINAAVLGITAWFTDALIVNGFWAALLGSIVISLVNWVASRLIDNDKEDEARMRAYRERYR
ncbi:MAG: phage holin family protein, partial [Chloroflexota bacterium]